MSDISHLLRVFSVEASDNQQWRKDLADRVAAQIALLRAEHKDYKRRAEAAEAERDSAIKAFDDTLKDLKDMMAERNQLLSQVQPANGIPIIAEITPHADPVYGHCFQWPAQEVNQFIEMQAEQAK